LRPSIFILDRDQYIGYRVCSAKKKESIFEEVYYRLWPPRRDKKRKGRRAMLECNRCNGEYIVETYEGDEVRYFCTKCRKEFEGLAEEDEGIAK